MYIKAIGKPSDCQKSPEKSGLFLCFYGTINTVILNTIIIIAVIFDLRSGIYVIHKGTTREGRAR